MEEKEEKKSLGYRLGELLGTVLIGSIIVIIIAVTAKVLTMMF